MWLFQYRDACWYCKCVTNSNLNVTIILNLKQTSTILHTKVDTMFTQCCPNVVSTSVSSDGDWCCHNVYTMLPECCLNINPHCWGAILLQQSNNIAWMVSQCWSPTLGSDIATIFTQCCYNIVSMSVTLEINIATTFTQYCLKVVSVSVPNIGEWSCHNIHTTMVQCCYNVGPHCDNIVATLGFWSKYSERHLASIGWLASLGPLESHWCFVCRDSNTQET